MSKAISIFLILAFGFTHSACRQSVTDQFIVTDEPLIALTRLRVIDGTGSPVSEDQTIIIEAGRIKAIGRATDVQVPDNAKVMDLAGHTAIPGLVGMHDHLFYPVEGGKKYVSASVSFPPLYLACGVTTIRQVPSILTAMSKLAN